MKNSKTEADTPQGNAWGEQSTQNSKRALELNRNGESEDDGSDGARLKNKTDFN